MNNQPLRTRPRLATHNLASLDGRLTIAPNVLLLHGDPRWDAIAGDAAADTAYALMKELHRPEVILEGSGSFVTDDALPLELPAVPEGGFDPREDFLPAEVVVEGRKGFLAVVDGRGRIRWYYKEFPGEEWQGWRLLVLVSSTTPRAYLAYLRGENIPCIVAGDGPVDLRLALERMAAELGVVSVVSAGGGRLNGALLRQGLVDEIDVEVLPAVIGGRGTPALFDAPPLGKNERPAALTLLSADERPDGHLLLRYSVR